MTVAPRRRIAAKRTYATLRGTLIGYGVGAYALLHLGSWSDAASPAYLYAGLGVQLALMAARALIRRRLPDPDAAAQAMLVVELIADGATVLLFALATLGMITHAADRF